MEPELYRRARSAYERARLWGALPWLLPAVLAAMVGYSAHRRVEVLAISAVLGVLLVGLAFLGRGWARGAPLGLAAGSVTAAYPLLFACGSGCDTACDMTCALVTAAIGGASGLFLLRVSSLSAALGALMTASLLASVGCVSVGAGGFLAIAAVWLGGSLAAAPGVLRHSAVN